MTTLEATRKRETRATARDLIIPAVADLSRRGECEADDGLWLRTYCPDVFYNPFTPHQSRIIDECGESLRYGTQKCKAAPRGDGKSSIVKYLALKYALARQVRFPLIIAATAAKAKKTLNSLKKRLATRKPSLLSADYPLECYVARYVDPWPSRARNVTANGRRGVYVEWAADSIIVPTWEDEEPLGPIILALGVTSDELQGCNIYDQRPDFVMLDDLDSRDSLASEDGVVAGKIEETIDKTVAGLGGQSRRLGQFMLCTITSRDSAAFKYSSPALKPSWSGERIAAIEAWPERKDLWEKYIAERCAGKTPDKDGKIPDVFGRRAHEFYLANRDEMDRGSVLSNPFNFEADELPDGSQKQVSALQRCYDYIADYGMDSFLTEHQNDPPEDEAPESSQITANLVASRISGLNHRELPAACEKVVSFIDLGESFCTWTDTAWRGQCIGNVIDNGTIDVRGGPVDPKTRLRNPETLELALLKVLHEWRDNLLAKYSDSNDQSRLIDLALVDSGSGVHTKAVYKFCKEVGPPFYPTKGMHDNWRIPKDSRTYGDRWALVRQAEGIYVYHFEATFWKQFAHQRLLTPTFDENSQVRPGSLSLFVCPEQEQFRKDRREFAHQIVGEIWGQKVLNGKFGWIIRGRNHGLDCVAGNCLAANIVGIRLIGDLPKRRPPADQRPGADYFKGRGK